MIIQEKINQAKEILKEKNIDCWITFVRESSINGDPSLVFLAPGYVTWHSAFIITATGESFAIVGRYDKQTIEETGAYDQVLDYVESVKQPLQKTIQEINPKQIAVNYSEGSEICDGITHGMFLTLTKYMEEIGFGDRIISGEKIVSALRERKSSTEIQHMRDAIDITQQIFRDVTAYIRPDRTEKEIADFMSSEVAKRGLVTAWSPDSCPSVFTGPDTAEAHYQPTDRKVEPGHILNMDFGVKVKGYCSDMQRTFYVLKPGETAPPEAVQHGFNTIVDAVQSSMDAMKPGIQAFEVDAVSRQILEKNGYDEFPHALGHQVGRFAHDGTAILGPKWEKYAQKPYQKLEPGMVFTIEPRLTVPDYGVATIEEMVLVTETGAEWLSKPQKEIIVISS